MTIPSPKTVVPSHIKLAQLLRRTLLLAGMGSVIVLSPEAARAEFHLWDITEVYSSADGSVQFIELVALSGGQQYFHSIGADTATLRSVNDVGTNTFFFTTDLPGDTTNKTCIVGTANLATIPGGVVPDYIIPSNFILRPIAGGNAAVIFDPLPFTAAFTNLPSDGDSSLVSAGDSMVISPTNSPKNFNDESNSIVPVKLKSIGRNGNNFILSFATATGANGTAGPNYAVEYNNSLTVLNWTTLTNVAGAGAITNVTDVGPPGLQRFYRLRVP